MQPQAWEIWNAYDPNEDEYTRVLIINTDPLEALPLIETDGGWEVDVEQAVSLDGKRLCRKLDQLTVEEALEVARAYFASLEGR